MTFLQPFILWGLPLILLPVIIHLINRLRHRPQPWAAMRFLLTATRASTSHAKLRQFLILLFRVLAVAMLLLFLARPLAGGWMGWMLSPAPDAVLILLDRSASMETKLPGGSTKREQALKLVSEAAKPFQGASHIVLIDSALRSPQEIANVASLSEPSLTGKTDTAADIPALVQTAFNYLIETRSGSAEIWIASDLQRSNWQTDDARFKTAVSQLASLPQKVRVRLLALNQPSERNNSIEILEAIRRARGENSELQFSVDFQRTHDANEDVPLRTVLDGAESQTEVSLDGQAMRWRHKLDLASKRDAGWGRFELPTDANPQDNSAYFVYGGETALRSAIVANDSPSAKVLKVVASVVGKRSDAVEITSPSEAGRLELENESLVVWQGVLPTGAEADRIKSFVEQGGVAFFLPSGVAESASFEGLGWGEVQNAESDKAFHITRWDEQQGPLAKTDEGFSLPLQQTDFKRRQLVNGKGNVLGAFEDGVPFLLRQTLGKGQIYFCASLPNAEWSTLGDGPVLVPMIQRLLQTGSRRLQQVSFVNCGELGLADQQRQWTSVDVPGGKNIRMNAGVYRSGERLVAVNRPASEDDPEIIDANETKNLFAGVSFQFLQDRETRSDALQGEIWRLFLFGMLAFLIGESFLILPGKPAQKTNANAKSVGPKAEVVA